MRWATLTVVIGLAALAAPLHAQPAQLKSLKRTVDTVVIQGTQLGPKIVGKHKRLIRVYACRSGVMVPILYQLDERNKDGVFCWTHGPRESRIRDEDRGRIDANDEFSVLIRDVGDRATSMQLRQVPKYSAVQEIEIWDPLDKGKGWIYIYRFKRNKLPVRLQNRVVSVRSVDHGDEKFTWHWYAENFYFNNDRSRTNAVRATFGSFAKKSGQRDYRNTPNLLDSTQVRAVVSFGPFTVVRQSNDIKVALGGRIDGRVRIIAENKLEVLLALEYYVSAPASHIILWRNKISMPTNASCPVDLSDSGESSYALCVDLNRRVMNKGWKFYNSHNSTPVTIDGRISSGERNLRRGSFPKWNCAYGPEGAMITKFKVPPFLSNRKRSGLVYVDDEYHKRKDEAEAGLEFQKGAIGYHGYYVDMRGLKKGIYPGDYVVWYAPKGFKPGDEKLYLNEYDHPVRAKPTDVLR